MISKLCTKRLQQKTVQRSLHFLAASLFLLLSACATKPVAPTHFDGKWQSCEIAPDKNVMGLSEEDLAKLVKLLNKCGAE